MIKNKTISCILASSIAFASLTPINANSAGINHAPNSKFEYELSADLIKRKESDGTFNDLVKLTFNVTNNPGAYQVTFAFKFNCKNCDEIKYDIVGADFSKNLIDNSYFVQPIVNKDKNICLVDIVTNFTNDPEFWPYDLNDNFFYSIYLDIDDSKLYDYEFSSAVVAYKSLTENIDIDIPASEGLLTPESSISATDKGIPYIVGDVVRDNVINISDATEILKIVSCATKDQEVASVDNINNLISAGVATETVDWAHDFPGLILNSKYACAEIADADNDDNHIISQSDATSVLQYYSNSAAGLDVDKYIKSEQFKTITMFQSTKIEN